MERDDLERNSDCRQTETSTLGGLDCESSIIEVVQLWLIFVQGFFKAFQDDFNNVWRFSVD